MSASRIFRIVAIDVSSTTVGVVAGAPHERTACQVAFSDIAQAVRKAIGR